ncbi:hypothetical protein HaloA020_04720 [Halomonas sp. A020]|nr:hypothetical protein HaloA020_04720 [Halomonas sp. A020]
MAEGGKGGCASQFEHIWEPLKQEEFEQEITGPLCGNPAMILESGVHTKSTR